MVFAHVQELVLQPDVQVSPAALVVRVLFQFSVSPCFMVGSTPMEGKVTAEKHTGTEAGNVYLPPNVYRAICPARTGLLLRLAERGNRLICWVWHTTALWFDTAVGSASLINVAWAGGYFRHLFGDACVLVVVRLLAHTQPFCVRQQGLGEDAC